MDSPNLGVGENQQISAKARVPAPHQEFNNVFDLIVLILFVIYFYIITVSRPTTMY